MPNRSAAKIVWRTLALLFGIPLLLVGVLSLVVVFKKDVLIEQALDYAHRQIPGRISVRETRLAPLENFPYISIDLKGLEIYESKSATSPIVQLNDLYVGFDFWSIVNGAFEIKAIKVKEGEVHLVQYDDNQWNIVRAILNEMPEETDEEDAPLRLNLDKLKIQNVKLTKTSMRNATKVELTLHSLLSNLSKNEEKIDLNLETDFYLGLQTHHDSVWFTQKHFGLSTALRFDKTNQKLTLEQTKLAYANAEFGVKGSILFADVWESDLLLEGQKNSFDLLLAFMPDEVETLLSRYQNQGDIYFKATVKGPISGGEQPHVDAVFGCKKGFFNHNVTQKKLDDLAFRATFTNGTKRSLETAVFTLQNFQARPEAGHFKANASVTNFISPEVSVELQSQFDVDFLYKFFNLTQFKHLSGSVGLTLNFRDIIDLNQPEKSLKKLDQSYFSKLEIKDLALENEQFKLPIRKLNVSAEMTNEALTLHHLSVHIGSSDVSISGKLENIPALLHQTDEAIAGFIAFESKKMNLKELSKAAKISFETEEVVKNSKGRFHFNGIAKHWKNEVLPQGNFSIQHFYAQLTHYPHTFANVSADISVDSSRILLRKLYGIIDNTKLEAKGSLSQYKALKEEKLKTQTTAVLNVQSDEIVLKDILGKKAYTVLPKEYQSERIQNFVWHSKAELTQKGSLKEWVIDVQKCQGRLAEHKTHINNGKAKLSWEDSTLTIHHFKGNVGKSDFALSGKKHFKKSDSKKSTSWTFSSNYFDLDELVYYMPKKPSITDKEVKEQHENAYNWFETSLPNMEVSLDIKSFYYHKTPLKNLIIRAKTRDNQEIDVQRFSLDAADGHWQLSGKIEGKNKEKIYITPDLKIQNVDLTKVFLKMEHAGKDFSIDEHIQGIINGRIRGKIALYPDFTPKLDQSKIQLDIAVKEGRIMKFAPIEALSDFFGDKNLSRVNFGYLENRFTFENGQLTIPMMTIESSLGYLQVGGTQQKTGAMNYVVRVPWRMVTRAASQKLFGRKVEDIDPEREDDVIRQDPQRKSRFINVEISGTPQNYQVRLVRNRTIAHQSFQKDDTFLFENEAKQTD